MSELPQHRPMGVRTPVFDLEARCLGFARQVREFVPLLPRRLANFEDVRQLIRSSGAIGANYIEGNEALGKKDFVMRLRVARKEAKETRYWLQLVDCGAQVSVEERRTALIDEAGELLRILSAIILKAQKPE